MKPYDKSKARKRSYKERPPPFIARNWPNYRWFDNATDKESVQEAMQLSKMIWGDGPRLRSRGSFQNPVGRSPWSGWPTDEGAVCLRKLLRDVAEGKESSVEGWKGLKGRWNKKR